MDKVYQAGSGCTAPLTVTIMPENRPLGTTQSRSRPPGKARSDRKIRAFSSSFAHGRGDGFSRFMETANRPGRRGCKKIITARHNLAASLPSSPFSRRGDPRLAPWDGFPGGSSRNRRDSEFQKTTRPPEADCLGKLYFSAKHRDGGGKSGGDQNCTSKPAVIRSWSQSVCPSFSE